MFKTAKKFPKANNLKKCCAASIFFASCFLMVSQNTFASSATKNIYGVNMAVTTDKDEYEFGEDINLSCTAENYSANNVNIVKITPFTSTSDVKLEAPSLSGTLSVGKKVEAYKKSAVAAGFEQWKNVNIGGQDIKVGIRALSGIVEEGSNFIVEPVNHSTQEYRTYFEQLDDRNQVERVNFFNLGIKKPNGDFYTTLDGYVTVYIQIPENWDEADLQAVFVSAGVDEQFQENFVTVDGIKYLSFNTNHFSPYAVIDLLTEKDRIGLKTGDYVQYDLSFVCAIFLFALIIFIISGKKIKNKALLLLLFLITISFCDVNFNSKVFASNDYFNVTDYITNTIYIGGNEVTITTEVTLGVVKPTVEITDESFGPCDEISLKLENIPTGWTGSYEIYNNSDKLVVSGKFTSSDIIGNTYILSDLNLDIDKYTIKVYDQYKNELATLCFELEDY